MEDDPNGLKIFSANVLQGNAAYEKLLLQIRRMNPDLIFLPETNKAWANATSGLKENYLYQLLSILRNIRPLFYSSFRLEKNGALFHVKDDITSDEVSGVLREF